MKIIAYILMAAFVLLMLGTFFFAVKAKGRKQFIMFTYALLFVYTIFVGAFYANNVPDSAPDESSHISYVYYLNQTKEIIPHFENIGTFNHFIMKWSEDPNYVYYPENINYLCHPPLYYHIMRLAGGFVPTETENVVTIYKMQLRYFSLGISAVGLLLMLYIGYSRLPKTKPWAHLLYAVTVTSIPMLSFELCAVTNDALTLTTTALCILGLIRFCEEKRSVPTYLLIATGITTSLLTKLTAAMLCIFMALMVLFITMIKERSILKSLNKQFLISLPVYAIAFAYYGLVYQRYGIFRPSLESICSPEYFKSTIYYVAEADRISYTFSEYLSYYFERFFLSWSGIEAVIRFLKTYTYSLTAIPYELLWVLPVLLFIPEINKNAGKLSLPLITGWLASIITFVYQLKSAYGAYLTRGYRGGFASRYYLPFIPIFALGLVLVLIGMLTKTGFNEETAELEISDPIGLFSKKLIFNEIIYIIALGYAFLLFYGNFPFFLLHYGSELGQ
jgi:hypothetical protein